MNPKRGKPLLQPIRVEVVRGGRVESFHEVSAVLVHPDGSLLAGWGDLNQNVFPRSAIKPLQALALVLSGAVEDQGISEQEIALACSSHGGEPVHVEGVRKWLTRLGFDQNDLECGTHWPSHEESSRLLATQQECPNPIHNNCSGKHSGFLTLAKQLGVPHKGYIDANHPVQKKISSILETLCDVNLNQAPRGIDGCSMPTWAIPLRQMAKGMARWGTGKELHPELSSASEVIRKAMAHYPHLVAGSGRYCTRVLRHFKGRVLVKTGAEGVYCAAFPELNLGLALKCHDGQLRASESALGALFEKLGILDETGLKELRSNALKNHNGIFVGEIRTILPENEKQTQISKYTTGTPSPAKDEKNQSVNE